MPTALGPAFQVNRGDTTQDQTDPIAVALADGRFAIAWTDYTNPAINREPEIDFAVFAPGATPPDALSISGGEEAKEPGLAAVGDDVLTAYAAPGNEVVLRRVSDDGTTLERITIDTEDTLGRFVSAFLNVEVASSGPSSAFVTYTVRGRFDDGGDTPFDVYGRFVDLSTGELGPRVFVFGGLGSDEGVQGVATTALASGRYVVAISGVDDTTDTEMLFYLL